MLPGIGYVSVHSVLCGQLCMKCLITPIVKVGQKRLHVRAPGMLRDLNPRPRTASVFCWNTEIGMIMDPMCPEEFTDHI
jgi:hypothetical protein